MDMDLDLIAEVADGPMVIEELPDGNSLAVITCVTSVSCVTTTVCVTSVTSVTTNATASECAGTASTTVCGPCAVSLI